MTSTAAATSPTSPPLAQLDTYYRAIEDERLFSNERNLRFYLEYLFNGIDFEGKDMLDIGAGAGVNGFFAVCRGAHDVVCLEPEADGSSRSPQRSFERLKSRLGVRNIHLEPSMLQGHEFHGRKFDIVLLHSSVNHLDEEACIHLLEDPAAKDRYREIFRQIAALCRPGAKLIVNDCSRYNLFATLGLRNPIVPTIEWEKHQAPQVWATLLGDAGFKNPRIRWASLNRLGRPGRILGNRLSSYFLSSLFTLTMDKDGAPGRT